MSWSSRIIFSLTAIFLLGIFGWALLAPKEDISRKINRTIKEQSRQADLAFKGVAFEEISSGIKYWQLKAKNASVNNSSGLASLQEVTGTFFKNNRPVLRFISPAALWDMKKKEIYLDKPIGYDIILEKKVPALLRAQKNNELSIFNLPKLSSKDRGYWFQAKNLSWKLDDKKLLCTGGIVLRKGEVTGLADKLESDVGLEKIRLEGSPKIIITPEKLAPITLEAAVFEVISDQDKVVAEGAPVITWGEAKINAKGLVYSQISQLLEMTGDVVVNYKDIQAWGDSARYQTTKDLLVLSGNARAVQGENRLQGDQVIVSLGDQTISVVGQGKVIISE